MSFHHRHRRRIRRATLALACCALAAPPAAFAVPADSGPSVTPAAKLGDTPPTSPSRSPRPRRAATRPPTSRAPPARRNIRRRARSRSCGPSVRSCATSTRPCRSRCQAQRCCWLWAAWGSPSHAPASCGAGSPTAPTNAARRDPTLTPKVTETRRGSAHTTPVNAGKASVPPATSSALCRQTRGSLLRAPNLPATSALTTLGSRCRRTGQSPGMGARERPPGPPLVFDESSRPRAHGRQPLTEPHAHPRVRRVRDGSDRESLFAAERAKVQAFVGPVAGLRHTLSFGARGISGGRDR